MQHNNHVEHTCLLLFGHGGTQISLLHTLVSTHMGTEFGFVTSESTGSTGTQNGNYKSRRAANDDFSRFSAVGPGSGLDRA